jgi:hypothetical protein
LDGNLILVDGIASGKTGREGPFIHPHKNDVKRELDFESNFPPSKELKYSKFGERLSR